MEERSRQAMRSTGFILSLVIGLSLYGLINLYIFRKGWQALSRFPAGRIVFAAVFLILVLAFPVSRLLRTLAPGAAADQLLRLGILYAFLMVYLWLLFLLYDLFRLILRLAGRFDEARDAALHPPGSVGSVAALVVLLISLAFLFAGFVNARHVHIKTLDLCINKKAGALDRLNAVMASDFHLGAYNGSGRLRQLVEKINSLDPDIVLFAGDIVDESVSTAEEEEMIGILKKLRAPLGVFSVTGNHEYYSGLEKNLAYLERAGVQVLQDEALKIDNSFWVIGRKDRTARSFGDQRLSLREIIDNNSVDESLPLIVLDHQPLGLKEAEEAGIDLQLSGHTHAGQLFPISLINRRLYEQAWGYLRKGRTQYYVSSGAGTWGPPVRTGSISEIVQLKVRFDPKEPNL
jgi:predicted MPP superfamily phosphohydrolase